jgi:hypothetical protein
MVFIADAGNNRIVKIGYTGNYIDATPSSCGFTDIWRINVFTGMWVSEKAPIKISRLTY